MHAMQLDERTIRFGIFALLLCSYALGCNEPDLECEINPNIVDLESDTSPIHDPAIIETEGSYYVYSSSLLGSFYTSRDLREWEHAGRVFEAIPPWLLREIPAADHIGSPDVSYYRGRYLLFYQSHESGTCNAATGLATNVTLDPANPAYEWVDHGLVLRSKPYFSSVGSVCGDDQAVFNAIDPHFFEDVDGTPWLAIGSTIGGIKLVELDPETLMPQPDQDYVTLAQRFLLQEDPVIEGAYLLFRNGYYYLIALGLKVVPVKRLQPDQIVRVPPRISEGRVAELEKLLAQSEEAKSQAAEAAQFWEARHGGQAAESQTLRAALSTLEFTGDTARRQSPACRARVLRRLSPRYATHL